VNIFGIIFLVAIKKFGFVYKNRVSLYAKEQKYCNLEELFLIDLQGKYWQTSVFFHSSTYPLAALLTSLESKAVMH
jgi:hypothetical protein